MIGVRERFLYNKHTGAKDSVDKLKKHKLPKKINIDMYFFIFTNVYSDGSLSHGSFMGIKFI